jgi:putative intracellular protease/amidase
MIRKKISTITLSILLAAGCARDDKESTTDSTDGGSGSAAQGGGVVATGGGSGGSGDDGTTDSGGTTDGGTTGAGDSSDGSGSDMPKKVLLVVANDGFYFQEYNDPRLELEAAGFAVVVAAGRHETAMPHAGTGQTEGDGSLMPDLALADVVVSDYAALVFAGGWGASSYQYAFTGTIDNTAWRADPAIAGRANELIGEFLATDKYVAGICHGVSVLAWARVNGSSPLSGKNVTASDIGSPGLTYNGVHYNNYEFNSAQFSTDNGATVAAPNSVGDTGTPNDDVVVDGRIVTAQNQHAAKEAGKVLGQLLKQ